MTRGGAQKGEFVRLIKFNHLCCEHKFKLEEEEFSFDGHPYMSSEWLNPPFLVQNNCDSLANSGQLARRGILRVNKPYDEVLELLTLHSLIFCTEFIIPFMYLTT